MKTMKKILWAIVDSFNHKDEMTFEEYLIDVGVRSSEYNFDREFLYNHIDYFRKSYKDNLSAYKSLLFLTCE